MLLSVLSKLRILLPTRNSHPSDVLRVEGYLRGLRSNVDNNLGLSSFFFCLFLCYSLYYNKFCILHASLTPLRSDHPVRHSRSYRLRLSILHKFFSLLKRVERKEKETERKREG